MYLFRDPLARGEIGDELTVTLVGANQAKMYHLPSPFQVRNSEQQIGVVLVRPELCRIEHKGFLHPEVGDRGCAFAGSGIEGVGWRRVRQDQHILEGYLEKLGELRPADFRSCD